jgi:hypothetical protein
VNKEREEMAETKDQKTQQTGTPAGNTNTGMTSGVQQNPGGVGITGNDPANPKDSTKDTDKYDKRETRSRTAEKDERNTPRAVHEKDLERAQHVDEIMGRSGREGERQRLGLSGRDETTAVPTDEAGEGNPSVETPDRIREKVIRDSEDTTLQHAYRERDLTNGRQQTTDSHFRRDMIQEQMPKIPPSLLGTVGRMVDTPESVAMRQDDIVYESMKPPTDEQLFELGVHPDQNDPKVQESMRKAGVVVKKEAEEAREREEREKEEAKRQKAEQPKTVVVK